MTVPPSPSTRLPSKLRQTLQALSTDYSSRLAVIETHAHSIAEYSQGGSHLTFTPHGVSHISAVEHNYDWLLTDEDLKSFSAAELFCLICATLFHDSQMAPHHLADQAARAEHAERARGFLLKNQDLLERCA